MMLTAAEWAIVGLSLRVSVVAVGVTLPIAFALAWVLGDSMRTRRAYFAQLEERAARLEKEREAQAKVAVAAERARQYIHAHLERPLGLDELAQVAQRERWSLSRDFRALFGTSPYRYLIQRRLDIARRLMLGGQTLAEAALAAGFADQSHMTRHFGQSYGLPPARWLRMLGRA